MNALLKSVLLKQYIHGFIDELLEASVWGPVIGNAKVLSWHVVLEIKKIEQKLRTGYYGKNILNVSVVRLTLGLHISTNYRG